MTCDKCGTATGSSCGVRCQNCGAWLRRIGDRVEEAYWALHKALIKMDELGVSAKCADESGMVDLDHFPSLLAIPNKSIPKEQQ